MHRRSAIFSFLVLACAAAGCMRLADASGEPLESRENTLREIADQCGLPVRALRLNAAGDVRLRPRPETRFEVVDCTLAQLKERGLAERMPMGFVGNETPGGEDGNHASPH